MNTTTKVATLIAGLAIFLMGVRPSLTSHTETECREKGYSAWACYWGGWWGADYVRSWPDLRKTVPSKWRTVLPPGYWSEITDRGSLRYAHALLQSDGPVTMGDFIVPSTVMAGAAHSGGYTCEAVKSEIVLGVWLESGSKAGNYRAIVAPKYLFCDEPVGPQGLPGTATTTGESSPAIIGSGTVIYGDPKK